MARKKQKSKISSIKRSNQLRTKLLKQGKLKTKRNRNKPNKISRPVVPKNPTYSDDEDSSTNSDTVLDMFEDGDMSFLRNAVVNRSYSFLKDIDVNDDNKKLRKKKRKIQDDLDNLESQYEQSTGNLPSKRRKYLLPIKTKEGVIARSEEVNSSEDEDVEDISNSVSDNKEADKFTLFQGSNNVEEIRSADLLAFRKNSLAKKKFKIGILCSELTETPDQKIHNFKPLFEMLNENDTEVFFTVKKLAIVSLLEVFKDLLPEYLIKHHNDPKVKLKKSIKQLQTFEKSLLKYYKDYLKELEKIVSVLKKKKGDNRIIKEAHISLAELALKSLCNLLNAHPYFNFSKNIVHLLVPFLNNSKESIREIVVASIQELFRMDKRGEISLQTVRIINRFVKIKRNIVRPEVLSVLLSLNLKNVNLDKEKEKEILRRKSEAKKHKLLSMSKREKKKLKKFESLQKDLLETKAEENKKSREQCMTEITKCIFTIYFRILKETTSSKLLNSVLEGISKFAHCINIEFYHDLILVLDKLIQNKDIGYKEKLSCVWTVFTVLHYQGTTIYIDPIRFYSHFYANILQVDAGKNHSDLLLILKVTDFVLLKRRKHLSLQRLLAFTKRLTALSLQVLPNGSLALLRAIKEILEVNNSTDMLLDMELVQGQGTYYPEIEEPEYCNACATSLWELLPLQKHYHPTVREYATQIAKGKLMCEDKNQSRPLSLQSPLQIFEEFDAAGVKFNPPIPPPKKFSKATQKRQGLLNENLECHIKTTLQRFKIMNVDSLNMPSANLEIIK